MQKGAANEGFQIANWEREMKRNEKEKFDFELLSHIKNEWQSELVFLRFNKFYRQSKQFSR